MADRTLFQHAVLACAAQAEVVAGTSIKSNYRLQSQQVLYRSIDASVRVRCFTPKVRQLSTGDEGEMKARRRSSSVRILRQQA
jgi:hypothetical protein